MARSGQWSLLRAKRMSSSVLRPVIVRPAIVRPAFPRPAVVLTTILMAASLILSMVVLPVRAADGLSARGREKVFDKVWKTINRCFYDPTFGGVDWEAVGEAYRPKVVSAENDDRFWVLLNRMAGELGDAHTRVSSPRMRRQRLDRVATGTGILLDRIEGALVVVRVETDSEASKAGVEPGMIVRKIDGESVEEKQADLFARMDGGEVAGSRRFWSCMGLLRGAPDTTIRLELLGAGGTPLEATLTRRRVSSVPTVTSRLLPSGCGYIQISSFLPVVSVPVRQAILRLREAPAMILDLRGNPGGNEEELRRIADYVLSAETRLGTFIERRGQARRLLAGRAGEQLYDGELAILVDELTASAAEIFAGALQLKGKAEVFGRRSAGAAVTFYGYKRLKGGGEFTVGEGLYLLPDGLAVEGKGVVPDREIPLTLAGLQAGRDTVLDAAEAHLLARIGE